MATILHLPTLPCPGGRGSAPSVLLPQAQSHACQPGWHCVARVRDQQVPPLLGTPSFPLKSLDLLLSHEFQCGSAFVFGGFEDRGHGRVLPAEVMGPLL